MSESNDIRKDFQQELVKVAQDMMDRAYAPYSKFLVGAAILGADGKVYSGCNVENQSYGLTICAERTAACKLVSEGCQEIRAVAVSTSIGASPCGACRQFMSEFVSKENKNFPIFINNRSTGETITTSMQEILPQPVDLFFLKDQ
jgi:cytidine deaminase